MLENTLFLGNATTAKIISQPISILMKSMKLRLAVKIFWSST